MGCLPCQQARGHFTRSAAKFDLRGAAAAITRGVAINVDKMRGVDVNQKYGGKPIKAAPYKRPERTV